nr:MAG TPA: hypothetical protein [Caudoviricetes sp.]DAF28316.1 MAG TPA: hypothetical protein [Caudoviricetes sp.]DAJ46838.1 MAG TPA: hypothetical protein [Bacteriophage sp.]DAR74418.1 MAG TPA: hypothetical protein [Caudoviricetes sp.]DAU26596.1 MAG TPA: hypothetical protein [Caudoviricetes sp.]
MYVATVWVSTLLLYPKENECQLCRVTKLRRYVFHINPT